MNNFEQNVQTTGHKILNHEGNKLSSLSLKNWAQALMDKMIENESFRVPALRFTDVAPTLRNDAEFMQHLEAYFKETDGLQSFIGKSIPGKGLLGKVIAPIGRHNIKSMAKNFIAGETIEDGIKTFEKLHKEGIACSIDLLGEAVITKSEADGFLKSYHKAIKDISIAASSWKETSFPEKDTYGDIARANVSIKLSALYEHTSATAHESSLHALAERFSELLDTAKTYNAFVNVDMEQFELLPLTIDVFKTVLMDEKYRNYPHIGIVCQAYLKEGEGILNDLTTFAKKRGTPFSIRLVKGAYWDYEQANAEQKDWPCPVFSIKEDTDANYEKLTKQLIEAFPHVRPCIGSHNARSLAFAIETAKEEGLKVEDLEFQALYGMADNFRDALKEQGYRVRQYCPVGEFIPGMSYLVRRLLENTANQSFLRMQSRNEASGDELLSQPKFSQEEVKERAPFVNAAEKDFSLAYNRELAETALEHYKKDLPYKVGTGKDKIEHHCPWNKDILVTQVAGLNKKQTEAAVEKAKAAKNTWASLSHAERADILDKAADITEDEWKELFALQVYEAGKDWHSGDADITEAVDFMRYYAHQMRHLEAGMQPISLWGESNKTIYEAKGVAAVIAPWNFPFAISVGMTAAALVTGNTVLYKPAEQTSALGLKMVEIFHKAGVPVDALQFLPGVGEIVGETLINHKDVNMVAFTGSREVGLHILEKAGVLQKGQHHVKNCVIEMGGKNAIIVDSSADLDEAVPGVIYSAFGFQGQKCSACSRIIVVGSAYEPFTERMKEMVEGLRVGPADDTKFDVNAVIDAEAFNKCQKYIQIGKKDGKLLAQAPQATGEGNFVLPTVFTDLKDGSKLTKEEVFGPVTAVYKAKNIEEAVNMALDSEYALTGAIYSRNPDTIDYAREHFKVGNLYVNRGSTGALVGRQPFGGAALSGTGTKAGGPDYLFNFMNPRVITENTMRRGYAPKED